MGYTDRDLMVATQIAYYDFDLDLLETSNYNKTIRELLIQDNTVIRKIQADLQSADSDSDKDLAQGALELYNEIVSENSEYGDWIIRAVKDDNVKSGFYGCLIETSNDSAIVGFRGSEGNDTKDWVEADVGLVNGTETRQQMRAQDFMQEINEVFDYNNYASTGHSLGGNLSDHATIFAPEEIKSKITQSVSFDGPGFSDEYIRLHRNDIEKSKDVLRHYQWSLVGNLLFPLPGVEYKTIEIKENGKNKPITRHSTCYIEFDETGSVKKGKKDVVADICGNISRKLDESTSKDGLLVLPELFSYLFYSPIREWIGDGISFVQDIISGMRKWGESEEMRHSSKKIFKSGYFKINFEKTERVLIEFSSYCNELANIEAELENIRYHIGGNGTGFYRARKSLKQISSQIAKESKAMKQLMLKGNECLEFCRRTEKGIVEQSVGINTI